MSKVPYHTHQQALKAVARNLRVHLRRLAGGQCAGDGKGQRLEETKSDARSSWQRPVAVSGQVDLIHACHSLFPRYMAG